jgi:glycosyltransferase involved in cell wall biosynthesis
VRIAWFTPLPPMASGISDYSFEILPLMAERAVVDVFCPRPGTFHRVRGPAGVRVHTPKNFEREAGNYAAIFYQLGNNPWHRFVYQAAIRVPGVAVFHDFVMHHLIADMCVESSYDPEGYEALLRAEYGERGGRLAQLRLGGVATEFEKFLFPLNGQLARASRAIVVHNEDSAQRMRGIVPGIDVTVIPHHAGSPPAAVRGVDRAAARTLLGLPRSAFLVGHFGFITRPKQPGAVLGGFAMLAGRDPRAELIMIGADVTGGGLHQLMRRLGIESRVRLAGFVDLTRFYLYLRAVDAVINLRYPSAGESSGTFARALAEGRPTIVNHLGSFAEVPPDVALKVEIDGDQSEQVGEHLIRLAEDPAFRSQIEANARAYAVAVLDPIRCRDLYLRVAGQVSAVPLEPAITSPIET